MVGAILAGGEVVNLSGDQVKTFWSMWAKACRKQNWTRQAGMSAADIDEKRKELLARCGFKSLTLVDRLDGFTKVKNELLILISDNTDLKAAEETENPLLNQSRVFRHKIMNELTPCLALYVEDVPAYITSIMEDKNRWWKIDRPACEITLEDLDAKPIIRRVKNKTSGQWEPKEFPSTLEQLMMTINARVHEKRRAARHTIHDMKIAAGVECDCAPCCRARVTVSGPIVPPLPAGTDSQPDTAEILKPTGNENPF